MPRGSTGGVRQFQVGKLVLPQPTKQEHVFKFDIIVCVLVGVKVKNRLSHLVGHPQGLLTGKCVAFAPDVFVQVTICTFEHQNPGATGA